MFSCLSLSLLFLILFCDIFVVLVESLVDSKPGIVEPEVDVVDCGKNFFTDKKYMPKIIVNAMDTTLTNIVVNIFPTSTTLVCQYYI
jgi:hypothetical protein